MASSAVIGALRVVIGADSAALDKGLSDASNRLASFGSSVAKAGVAAAAAFVAAGAAIGVAVKHAIDSADNLGKAAQKIGVPVEELSALKFAAELSDVSLESLTKSLGKLSTAMVEAAAKPTSEAALAFKSLGISATDSQGKLKTSSQVMGDIAGKFEGLKDGAGKTAVSIALFGKAGAEMIPLLNVGADGIRDYMKEAAQLGIVLSKQTTTAAEEFNDNLKRLGKVKDGIILQITAGMLPALKNLSANFVLAAKDADLLTATGAAMGNWMTQAVIEVALLGLAWKRLGVEWQALKEFLTSPLSTANWEKFKAAGEETVRLMAALRVTMETAHLADAFGPVAERVKAAAKAQGDYNFAARAGKNAVDSFIDSTNKSLAAQQADLATVGLAAGAKERLRVVLQGMAIATANETALLEPLRAKLYATAFAAEQMALKLQGATLVQQNLDPLIAYQTQLANTTIAMQAVGATAEQIGRAQTKVANDFGMSWEAVGTNIAGTAGALSQLTGVFAKENKAMGIASKAFGIGQAIINTQIAITKALATLPPPASYAAAAFAAAQGAVSIATIMRQGFQTGGSFRVGGGSGGGDSKLMQFMAEPGEMVDIHKNGSDGGGRGWAREITVRGVNPTDIFTGKQLIETLNDAIGDGARLRFAPA